MDWGGDAELALIALAAMESPTTLSFSVLALVLGDRPLRTGLWFYLGALSAQRLDPAPTMRPAPATALPASAILRA